LFTKAPLDEAVLAEDLERIKTYCRSQGFYHAQIESYEVVPLLGREVILEIQLKEGPPIVVSDLTLEVDEQPSGPWHEELLKVMPLHPGDGSAPPLIRESKKAALRYLSEWGYPKARVDLKAQLNKQTNLAEISVAVMLVRLVIWPGDREGNVNVGTQVILRELTFYPGDRFNGSKVQETQQRLFGLDLLQFVDMTVENMDGNDTLLPIHILVKEAKKQTVRVGFGYGTVEEFRGQLQWQIRNFMGDGRRLQVNAKASSLIQLLAGQFLQPYFLSPRSYLTVDGGIQHEDQVSFENQKEYVVPVFQLQVER